MPLRSRFRLVWVLGFLLLILAVVYAAFGYLYVSFRSQLDRELGRRLTAVASTAALAVGGDTWERLVAGDSLAVRRVREDLDQVRRANDLADVFLFDTDETTRLDLGGLYPEGEKNPALGFDVVAVTTALAGIPMHTSLYEARGAYLKSAYAPVTGADGEIVGGIGVEASAAFLSVMNQVRRTLLGAAVLVLIGTLLLGVVFARLLQARASLEARLDRVETLATLGQMTAMLAHEIRNPLGIIRGAAERIARRYQAEDDEMLRFIPEEVDRLEATLGSFLDFARPRGEDSGADLREALERSLVLFSDEFARKGIRVERDLEEGEFPVGGEGGLLPQAFLNLLLNARDAMPDGGTLQVALRRRKDRAEVSFRDDGIGMTEEVLRRATEPFFTGKETGSGLGLAVVRRVVESMNGSLTLAGRPGEGTTVTLMFPLRKGAGRTGDGA